MNGLANEIDLAVQLAPPKIVDDSGVPLAVHHLEFIGCKAQALADWRARRAPMGMTPCEYREFRSDFFAAATNDNLPELDVRLKWSAAVLYSGRHKELPGSRAEILAAFQKLHGHVAQQEEKDDLFDRFRRFRAYQPLPRRRPFDCMYNLNLDSEPSDFDIQLCSQEIEYRCVMLLAIPRLNGSRPMRNLKYGFLDDTLVALAAPNIARWANLWTVKLKRTVAVKAFGASGPGNVTKDVGDLSSHFRAQDWMIVPLQPGD